MKRLNHVWENFCDEATLRQAIENAAKGKRRYAKVRRILKEKDKFARELSKTLSRGKFKPSPYRVDVMKTEYGKLREIFKLPFYPDRNVQHAISLVMRERWDKSLTSDTYACMQDRGINCNIKRFNMRHKVRRAICSYRHRTVFVLKMDISKCYPSVDNDIMAQTYRRYCKDSKMVELMDSINYNSDGLPIGNFLSQLWINLYLNPLDRFIKEELKARHYFRYMDDIVLLCEDKSLLHQWQWRIMNFLWYSLRLLCNSKRQVFPLGRNRTERGIDFGGYVFYHDCILVRKRIKQAFARKRHKPKSIPSYIGILKHCDGRNLIDKIVNRNNDMDLAQLIGKKIERPFEGDAIKIEALIDRPIEILDFQIRPSEKKSGTDYLKLQIRIDGNKRFVGGGYQFLCQVLKQIDKSNLPLQTVIRNKRGYYFEGTIDE